MKKLIILLTVVLLATYTSPTQAAMKKLAQTGLQFLKVDMSSRAAAMGGAFEMIGTGAEAMFYNPAGIAKAPNSFDMILTQTQWIADITYNAVGLMTNQGNWGTFGVSAIFCDYGEIQGAQVAANEQGYLLTGNVDVGAMAVGVSYARNLSTKFTVGGQIKWASQNLGESMINDSSMVANNVDGLAFDFGTMFYPGWKSFRFGISIRNFSQEFTYQRESFQLPLTFKMGAAMDILDLFNEDHENQLLVAIDALHPRDYSERLHFGAEYTYNNMFALRAGYKTNYDEEGLTAGFGINFNVSGIYMKVDYAYSAFGVFSSVNRFSFGLAF